MIMIDTTDIVTIITGLILVWAIIETFTPKKKK